MLKHSELIDAKVAETSQFTPSRKQSVPHKTETTPKLGGMMKMPSHYSSVIQEESNMLPLKEHRTLKRTKSQRKPITEYKSSPRSLIQMINPTPTIKKVQPAAKNTSFSHGQRNKLLSSKRPSEQFNWLNENGKVIDALSKHKGG